MLPCSTLRVYVDARGTTAGVEVMAMSEISAESVRAPQGWCCRCRRRVYWCRGMRGSLVAVEPEPVCGGGLVINSAMTAIVAEMTWFEADKARRGGRVGFVAHDEVCPARFG